ncbi:hypothetical protein M422DRAFT_245486 [Sphaerobolus stellatus SS14]|nr:hypothetical protein M422DRAFT_245486 [Sphaerobolus stellatus SS14]
MQWERVGLRVGKAGVTRRQSQTRRHLCHEATHVLNPLITLLPRKLLTTSSILSKMSGISVVAVALQGAPHPKLKAGRPSPLANDAATHLTNPWPSFRSLLLPALPNANASSPSIGTDGDLISSWVALGPPLS